MSKVDYDSKSEEDEEEDEGSVYSICNEDEGSVYDDDLVSGISYILLFSIHDII
jgi:hypothetical protein